MADTVGSILNPKIWVHGQTVDPILYIANQRQTSEDVTISIVDVFGNVVTSTSITILNGTRTTVQLGDVLSAVSPAPDEGFYSVVVQPTSVPGHTHPLIIAAGGATDLPTPGAELPSTARIQTVLAQDKETGLIALLPPDPGTQVPWSDRFLVTVYVYDTATKKGAIYWRDGTGTWQHTEWARRALVEYTFQFNTVDEMAVWLLAYSNADTADEANALLDLFIDKRYNELARIAQLYFTEPAIIGLGRLLDYKVDIDNLKITVKAVTYLGFGWGTILNAMKYALAPAVIGAGAAGTVAQTIGAGGLGALAAAGITAGATGLILATQQITGGTTSGGGGVLPGPEDYMGTVRAVGEQGKQNVDSAYNDANNTLDTLYENGEISLTAYNTLKNKIQVLRDAAFSAIEDTVNECRNALDKCVSDYKVRLLLAGLGGGVGGYILGKAT